ncbi:MAG: hypothetical protein ACKVU0_10165 [Saprospiraceae bacterium]
MHHAVAALVVLERDWEVAGGEELFPGTAGRACLAHPVGLVDVDGRDHGHKTVNHAVAAQKCRERDEMIACSGMVLAGALYSLSLANLDEFGGGDILANVDVQAEEGSIRADDGLGANLGRACFQPLDVY